jgi:hypothetical protein
MEPVEASDNKSTQETSMDKPKTNTVMMEKTNQSIREDNLFQFPSR